MRKHGTVPILLLLLFLLARPWDTRGTGARREEAQQIIPVVATRTFAPMRATTAVPTTVSVAPSPTAPTPTASPTATMPPTSTVPEASPTLAATDAPVLEPQIAPPTPAPTTMAKPKASEPVRLIIPAVGLDLKLISVGLDERRIPIVPKHAAGWFKGSAMPGQGSNVVFWGHVLRWKDSPNIPAPFARMHELQIGAQIRVITADGQEYSYRVAHQVQVRPDQVSYILPTSSERLTLVSCIGDKVIKEGTLTKEFRLITVAEPVR